jgi:anti-sigma factor RsiW
MSEQNCAEMRLLMQADLDGELDAGRAAAVAAHLAACPDCAEAAGALAALSASLREHAPRHAAPDSLRRSLAARFALPPAPPALARRAWLGRGLAFGAGLALAASVTVLVWPPRGGDLAGAVLAAHIRALQPGHLTDVQSSDQHTVKPWFDGRLDYAPPVKDLAGAGFPLLGGRLDYLGGRPVAALIYGRRQHRIDLFAWPDQDAPALPPELETREGYHIIHWRAQGMALWAVSDLDPGELADFVRDLQAG